ncbi:MAG: histidine kinase [Lachnospiraceae bacterium]|nr:histidine kinase [Lachnospiraceae bacterium]
MRKWLLNLKLTKKFFLLIVLVVLSLFLTEMLNRQNAYNKYNQKIYEQNAQILSFYVNYIETVFERIEAVTYSIIGDQNLQEELVYIKENYRELGYSSNLKAANSRIRSYFQKEPYFKYFLLKTDVYQFSYGGVAATEEEIDQYLEYGRDKEGRLQMISEEGRLLLVRELRKAAGSEYVHLGYILAWVDFEGIVSDMRNAFANDSQDIDLAIYDGDICLYSNSQELENYQETDDGWYSAGDDFVVVYTPPELGYTMILRANYARMQGEIQNIYRTSLLTSFLAVIVAVMLSNYLVKQVIRALERIIFKMDDYGKGTLPDREEEKCYLERGDEVGRLYRHFFRMAEDYKKLMDAYYENEMMMREMEFSWLQKQIQPHLLYNTLSAVSWMAYSNKDVETAHMVEVLGRMMRTITDQKEAMISVDKDLQIVEDYVTIQKLRFGSRLQVSIEISQETRKRLIPKISIQPLVENSVIHGLDEMIGDCVIRIFERDCEDVTEIVVEDNGPGFEWDMAESREQQNGASGGSGIALCNISRRLQYAFPGKSGLEFRRIDGGMQVCIRIPKE